MTASIYMKVMTYNIQHGEGMDGKTSLHRIEEEIAKANADIIALQGVDRFLPRSGLKDQLNRMAKKFGLYSCFSPSVNLLIVQYGNGILSRYPIISKQIKYIGGSIERRSILTVRLQIDGGTVTVLNTHLGANAEERIKQAPILWDEINKLERPAIVAGDFNMKIDDPLMEPMRSRLHKIMLQNEPPKDEIDHIFVNFPTEKDSAWVQRSAASDHYPILAELHW